MINNNFHLDSRNEINVEPLDFIESLQEMASLPEPLDSSPTIENVTSQVEHFQNNSIEEQERNKNFQDINAFYLQV